MEHGGGAGGGKRTDGQGKAKKEEEKEELGLSLEGWLVRALKGLDDSWPMAKIDGLGRERVKDMRG